LKQHMDHSKKDLRYFDPVKNEKYVPYVIEPSLGADRVTLAFLCSAFEEEDIGTAEKPDVRNVMHFHPFLAPIKIAVLPLSAKLSENAGKVYETLSKKYMCEFDDRQSIGKRYRRQDEIGTPYCVVYDFDSEEDGCVTIRERDTMKNIEFEPGNIRFPIDKLDEFFNGKFDF